MQSATSSKRLSRALARGSSGNPGRHSAVLSAEPLNSGDPALLMSETVKVPNAETVRKLKQLGLRCPGEFVLVSTVLRSVAPKTFLVQATFSCEKLRQVTTKKAPGKIIFFKRFRGQKPSGLATVSLKGMMARVWLSNGLISNKTGKELTR